MEIEITFKDMVRGLMARLGKFTWMLAIFTVSGVVHLVRGTQVGVGLFMSAIVPLLLAVTYWSFARLDDVHRRLETRVDGDGVHHRTGASSSVIAFADISKVRWTKHVILLFLGTGAVAMLLTRGIDADSQRRLQQATENRIERPTSVVKVIAVVVVLILAFVWLWTTVARRAG